MHLFNVKWSGSDIVSNKTLRSSVNQIKVYFQRFSLESQWYKFVFECQDLNQSQTLLMYYTVEILVPWYILTYFKQS